MYFELGNIGMESLIIYLFIYLFIYLSIYTQEKNSGWINQPAGLLLK